MPDIRDLITGLTAGTPASGDASLFVTGGEARKVDPSGYVEKALVDAKGDLIVASAANTVVRLPVGTDDHVLTADAAEPGGVKWAAAAAGGGGDLLAANNLSDLANVGTARTNLGLGTAAAENVEAFATAAQGALADTAVQPAAITDFVSSPTIATIVQLAQAAYDALDPPVSTTLYVIVPA